MKTEKWQKLDIKGLKICKHTITYPTFTKISQLKLWNTTVKYVELQNINSEQRADLGIWGMVNNQCTHLGVAIVGVNIA